NGQGTSSNTSAAGSGGFSGTSSATGSAGSSTGGGLPMGDTLPDRLVTTDVAAPEGVDKGVSNWRIWGTSSLKVAPVFTVPRGNCGTLVGYTTMGTARAARVAKLDADDKLQATFEVGTGLSLRGLAAEADGHFAALLWDDAADKIFVKRFDVAGTPGWSTEL